MRPEPESNDIEPHEAARPADSPRWFNARPIPVYIISVWCILQFIGILVFMRAHWQDVTQPMRLGVESPAAFLVKLLYPALLFAAGILLLSMRKAAIAAFALYLVWGCGKVVMQGNAFAGYLDLALVSGILVYCLRLRQQGRLR